MPRQVNFTVEITPDGKAIIRLPHGRGQQRDAAAVKDLTLELAEALGEVEERHIGDHHHHDHGHDHQHQHQKA